MMNEHITLTTLLVDDDIADQKLIKALMQKQDITNNLHTANNAEEAFDFLRCTMCDSGVTSLPDLILLDLNMPGMGGKEFLKQIKADEDLRHIPVVILTSSNLERDILDSYKLQAAGYVRKPASLAEFGSILGEIQHYWGVLCRLPQKE